MLLYRYKSREINMIFFLCVYYIIIFIRGTYLNHYKTSAGRGEREIPTAGHLRDDVFLLRRNPTFFIKLASYLFVRDVHFRYKQ